MKNWRTETGDAARNMRAKKRRAIFPGENGPSGCLFELERAGIELVVGAPLGD
jgi:hypothetical protein